MMNPFEFRTVPSIQVAWGAAQKLGENLTARFVARKALIVTDKGLVKAGLIAPVLDNMKTHGFAVSVFDQVVADPPEQIVLDCVAYAKRADIDVVIGLGGGSSMDVAKLAAVMLRSTQSLSEMYGIGNVIGGRLPLVLIPTTAGTGSEVTNISIITTGATTKMGVVSPQLYADFVLLDAELTIGLPAIHTAATGIDAMVHAIEAYTSKIKKNPMSDALGREALRLLNRHLIAACKDGKNKEAREGMLFGAMLAGQSFSNSPVAAVHALAYPLGGHYHITHGLSNALMLGPVLRFNAQVAAPLYTELADVVGAPKRQSSSAAHRSEDFVQYMIALMDASGAPRRLRDVNVTEKSLPVLATDAMKQTRLLANNPIEVTLQNALTLYHEAY